MKDDRIAKALSIISDLISDLNKIPKENFDWVNGECICNECSEKWYGKHSDNCKSIKISILNSIADSFKED
jgi:hypothetical protein